MAKKKKGALKADVAAEAKPATSKKVPAVASAVAAAVAPEAAESVATGKKRRKQRPLALAEPEPAPAGSDGAPAVEAPERKRKRKAVVAKGVDEDAVCDDAEGEEELPALRSNKQRKKSETAAAQAAATDGTSVPTGGPGLSTRGSSEDRTVFVDGVPYVWNIEKIKEFFSGCGAIDEVKAPTWQDSGRLRGFAHVTFESQAGRKKALAMDGIEAGKKGRYLKIDAAQPKAAPMVPAAADLEGMRRLFVKNLPYEATEKEIQDLFKPCGPIVEVRIPTSFGRSKGFAYVEFKSSKGLQAAVAMDNPSVRGRSLRLDVDQGRGPKAGFHYRTESFEPGVFGGRGRGGRGKGEKGRGKGKGDRDQRMPLL